MVLKTGSRVTGQLTMCNEEACSIGGRRIPVETIARIELAEKARVPAGARPVSVILTDGTLHTGTFSGLNLGYVWLGEQEFDRDGVAAILLAESASPTPPPGPAISSAAPPPSPMPSPRSGIVLLNELRIAPSGNASPFVELINVGQEPMSLEGLSLQNDQGAVIKLPAVPIETFHVVPVEASFLSRAVLLVGKDGIADAVWWGPRHPLAIRLCRGGRCSHPSAGSVVARLPGSRAPFTATQWALLDPDFATPRVANPLPPVSAFAGVPGMIFERKPRFSWYGVPGAGRYRIQIAADERFEKLLYDTIAPSAGSDVLVQEEHRGPELPQGEYFWRTQTIDAAGREAPFSEAVSFLIVPRVKLASLQASEEAAKPQPRIVRQLDVPIIKQRKDTAMLMLEALAENNPRAWDRPDPESGRPYCARAGVADIVAFYGGNIALDRLSYEGFKDERPGPELDLPETGMVDSEIKRIVRYALGTEGRYFANRYNETGGGDWPACRARNQQLGCGTTTPCPECPEEIEYSFGVNTIANIKKEIDAGRPILASTTDHVFLVTGYGSYKEYFVYVYMDEGGAFPVAANARSFSRKFDSYWTDLLPVKLAQQEPEIFTDRDGDGVVDFDEHSRRFSTDPAKRDSDDDGVDDKQDIRASVFDPEFGYVRAMAREAATNQDAIEAQVDFSARDSDGDGKPMELDPDSDGGRCKDGEEDLDGDGIRDASESSNFVGRDDTIDDEGKCAEVWTGKVLYREWQRSADGTLIETSYEIDARVSELRKIEVRDPEAMAQGKPARLWATTIGLSCKGTSLRAVHRAAGSNLSCTGAGSMTIPKRDADEGMIQRKVVERSMADLFGYEVPPGGFYMLGCDAGGEFTYPVNCVSSTHSWSGPGGFGFPVIGRHPTGGQETPRTDARVRTFDQPGRMAGSYAGQETDASTGTTNGAEVSWSLCRRGVRCPPPEPLPSEDPSTQSTEESPGRESA